MSDLEQQVIELQTQLAFQEDLLDSLNQTVSKQQQAILQLQSQLQRLLTEIKDIMEESSRGSDYSRLLEAEKPPHY